LRSLFGQDGSFRLRGGKVLPWLGVLLVTLFIGVYFYLDSPFATANLMEEECYLTVAGWLGEKPPEPLRVPDSAAGQAPKPVINDPFDRGYYELVAKYGGFRNGGDALTAALRKYMERAMPAPFPDVCRRVSLRVAKACKAYRSDRRQLGECFSRNVDAFRFGLGRFNQRYMDDPELRTRVEEAHLDLGI
jgi:hypothetical protein